MKVTLFKLALIAACSALVQAISIDVQPNKKSIPELEGLHLNKVRNFWKERSDKGKAKEIKVQKKSTSHAAK